MPNSANALEEDRFHGDQNNPSNPYDAFALPLVLAKASAIARKGQLSQAEAILQPLLESSKANEEVFVLLAKIKAQQKQWQNSKKMWERVLNLNPLHKEAKKALKRINRISTPSKIRPLYLCLFGLCVFIVGGMVYAERSSLHRNFSYVANKIDFSNVLDGYNVLKLWNGDFFPQTWDDYNIFKGLHFFSSSHAETSTENSSTSNNKQSTSPFQILTSLYSKTDSDTNKKPNPQANEEFDSSQNNTFAKKVAQSGEHSDMEPDGHLESMIPYITQSLQAKGWIKKYSLVIEYVDQSIQISGNITDSEIRGRIQSIVHEAAERSQLNVNEMNLHSAYTVQESDTLWDIALKYYEDAEYWKVISEYNQISPSNPLYVGKQIILPNPKREP